MDQIVKTSKLVKKIVDVLFWVAVAGGAVSLIAVIAILIAGANGAPVQWLNISLTLGSCKLTLAEPPTSRQWTALWSLILVNILIFGGASCYTLKILQRIFRPMAEGRPFDVSVSTALKKLAYAALFFGLVRFILESAVQSIMYKAFEIPLLFSSERVASCSVSVISDGSFIIFFVVLLLLSHIFRYGEELQRLSDETL